MRKWSMLGALLAVVFAAGAFAQATLTWTPFASGTDSGTYGAYANASGNVTNPRGLAIRATSSSDPLIEADYFLSCQGKARLQRGKIYVLSIGKAQKCNLNGSANVNSGSVTVTLLKGR